MKKAHKLFLIQIVIAIVLFVAFAIATKTLFYNDTNIDSYLSINDGVKEMAGSTRDLLDSLIVQNNVTFDPTSGVQLDRVFKNLKNTNDEKFLFVGSSQLRVIQGEKTINSYESLVSKKLEKFINKKNQTYNLSLGGMSTPEKLIVSKKASVVLNPENILIAVTPWDCLANKVRSGVTTIESQTYTLKTTLTNNSNTQNDLIFPLNINEKISSSLEGALDKNLSIYSKRRGIKKWLVDEAIKILKTAKDSIRNLNTPFNSSTTDYWLTFNQSLDNEAAWDNTISKTGSYSLKIINKEGTQSQWKGEEITLKTPTNMLEFEGWSKADSVSNNTRLYAIDHKITFTDNTILWYFKNMRFKKGTHDWERVSTTVTFEKKVKAIKPHLLFYGGIGTVWFDDIKAFPIVNTVKQPNIILNPSAEESLKERQNVSYSYNSEEWEKIKENMFLIIDYLKSNKAENKYLLLTPFWYDGKKSAYPQQEQYKALVTEVKNYCNKNNVTCIDASYILNKDNFGVYTNGKNKDKIDVLHFNREAHEILAKYIIENLN